MLVTWIMTEDENHRKKGLFKPKDLKQEVSKNALWRASVETVQDAMRSFVSPIRYFPNPLKTNPQPQSAI